jgi:transposase-like protein
MNNNNFEELNNRNLDNCLIYLLAIPIKIGYKPNDNQATENELYIFFSCNIRGVRKYVTSVFANDFNKTSDWYDFLLSLKNRGINVLLYAVIPNNDKLSKALKLAFNEVNIYISYSEIINKINKYYTESYTRNFYELIRKIYISNDINGFNIAYNDFCEQFVNYDFIKELLDNAFKRVKQYYNTDYEIRHFIFSIYFYRDTFKIISVISHSKKYFNSLDEFINELIPTIQRIESRMFCTKNELMAIINKLYVNYKDLIKPYL